MSVPDYEDSLRMLTLALRFDTREEILDTQCALASLSYLPPPLARLYQSLNETESHTFLPPTPASTPARPVRHYTQQLLTIPESPSLISTPVRPPSASSTLLSTPVRHTPMPSSRDEGSESDRELPAPILCRSKRKRRQIQDSPSPDRPLAPSLRKSTSPLASSSHTSGPLFSDPHATTGISLSSGSSGSSGGPGLLDANVQLAPRRCPRRGTKATSARASFQRAQEADQELIRNLATEQERLSRSDGTGTSGDQQQEEDEAAVMRSASSQWIRYKDIYLKSISAHSCDILTRICGFTAGILVNQEAVDTYRDALRGIKWENGTSAATLSTRVVALSSLASHAEKAVASMVFSRAISLILLAVEVNHLQSTTGLFKSDIFKQYVQPHMPKQNSATWHKWVQHGTRWTMWAQAATVHFIMLAALSEEATALIEVPQDDLQTLSAYIRDPIAGTLVGNLVQATIIPGINIIRKLAPTILKYNGDTLDLSDLQVSDTFFSKVHTQTFIVPRNQDKWSVQSNEWDDAGSEQEEDNIPLDDALLNNLSGTSDGEWEFEKADVEDEDIEVHTSEAPHQSDDILALISHSSFKGMTVVDTNYQVTHPANRYLLRGASERKRFDFTEAHRAVARNAIHMESIKKFSTELKKRLQSGALKQKQFLYLDPQLLKEQEYFHVRDIKKETLFILMPRLSDSICETLSSLIDSVFPGMRHYVDSAKEGFDHSFEAMHLTFYNRSARRGHDAPMEGNPWKLGKKGMKRQEPLQSLPRLAAEADERADCLEKAFGPIFDKLSEQVMRLIPDAGNVLEKYVEILPAGATSPLHPFGGLVINFNVVTGAHIDGKDERFCMLFVIQEGDGAEIRV